MEALLIAVIVIAFIRRITKKSYVALTYLLTSSSLFLYLWNLQLVCSNRKGASQIMSEQQKGSRVYIFEARRRILLGSNRFFFAPFHFSRQTSRILKKPLPPPPFSTTIKPFVSRPQGKLPMSALSWPLCGMSFPGPRDLESTPGPRGCLLPPPVGAPCPLERR